MKNNKWFWGLIALGAGVLLLLSALGIGEDLDAFRLLGSVLLVGISIESLVKSRFFLFPLPLALTAYLWRVQLGYANLNVTLLLAAAVLLGIGLSIIFHKRGQHSFEFHKSDDWKEVETVLGHSESQSVVNDNEFVNVESNFGEQIKYIHASNLKQANVSSHFAKMVVYFDQCQVSSEGLKINVSGSFTEIVLNVPRDWTIDSNISIFAASVSGLPQKATDNKTRVLLTGSINFGEVKINTI